MGERRRTDCAAMLEEKIALSKYTDSLQRAVGGEGIYILSPTLPRFLLMCLASNSQFSASASAPSPPESNVSLNVRLSDWCRLLFIYSFFLEVTTVRNCFYLCALGEELFMLLLGLE